MQINIHDAKSRLSELARVVLGGERVVIAKAGQPLVDLVPHHPQKESRQPGRLKGQIHLADDFDTTPKEVIDAFETE